MHDVQLHFGDLRKSWGRHGPEAVGMLFNLLCEYYDREEPLPDDMDALEDMAGAETKTQKAMLPRLLKKHLDRVETDAGWVWKWARCDLEIARYKHRCAVNAHNNLMKFVGKSSGRLTAPRFEDFAANIEHYRDPITGRFRNLGETAPPATNGIPIVSESETIGMRKVPTSGDHSPTLPLSQPPSSSVASPPADAASDSDHGEHPDSETESGVPEKKEKGGGGDDSGVWLDVGSPEAWRVINAALGRKAGHPFNGEELHALGIYASAMGGIGVGDMALLGRFLLAEPRYDDFTRGAWDRIPERSPLRLRKRRATNVISDLANQIEYARAWAGQGTAENGEVKATRVIAEPSGDWRAIAKELGFPVGPDDLWVMLDRSWQAAVVRRMKNQPKLATA